LNGFSKKKQKNKVYKKGKIMSMSKDPKVQDLRIEQNDLLLSANLVAGTSEAASLVSINNSTLTATVISIDVKEPVESVQKVQIVNKATGQHVAIAAAPVVSGNSVSVTCNGTGLTNVCIELSYR
jgi:hypothetical protein